MAAYRTEDYEFYRSTKVNRVSSGGYLCLLCGAVLSKPFTLKRHFQDIHAVREFIFTCPATQCSGRNFTSKSSFYSHVFAHHPEYKGMDLMSCARRIRQDT